MVLARFLVPCFDPEDPPGPCLGVGVGNKQNSKTKAFSGTNRVLVRETRKGKSPPGGRALGPELPRAASASASSVPPIALLMCKERGWGVDCKIGGLWLF